jgi:hypothetical protein
LLNSIESSPGAGARCSLLEAMASLREAAEGNGERVGAQSKPFRECRECDGPRVQTTGL